MQQWYKWILALSIVGNYLWGNPIGYTLASGWSERVLYTWSHQSVLHLVVNLLSITTLLGSIARAMSPLWVVLAALTSATLTTYVAATPLPTMGASGVAYYLLGVDLILRWSECYFRISPTQMERYTLSILLSMGFTAPLAWVNTPLHLANFCTGCATGWAVARGKFRSQ